jgi:uncharacterized protein (DUF885 family)
MHHKHFRAASLLAALSFLPGSPTPRMHAQTANSPLHQLDQSLTARRDALNKLLDEQWEYTLKNSPEQATLVGDYRYNDRWTVFTLAHIMEQKKDAQNFLARFEAIDTAGFTEQERLNKELIVRNLKDNIEGTDLKLFEMPLDQMNGIHLLLPQFASIVPLDSVKHYEDYIARLHKIPQVLAETTEIARLGKQDKLMPPKFLLEKVASQCDSIAGPAGLDNPFGQPAAHFPDSISAADQKRLRGEIIAAIDNEVRPAYRKLSEFVTKEYAPYGRTEMGLWSLPNGDALYRYSIRTQTTTDLPAEKIHELGLSEVARIEAEQTAIAHKLGAKDLKSFRASLKTDPKTFATSREQILDLYRKYIGQMNPELPKLFGLLPKAPVQVVPTQAFREKEAAGAEYNVGTPDGKRPGKVYVNTGDYQHRSLLSIESTAYHEGVPGHHMQLSIAQELPSLPPFRQHAGYTAYIEGWALYSERLGKDVGFYRDPYSDFGRLNDELLRADRLVLDTGVHAKHWSREQMVAFFHDHSGEDEPDIQSETDRYIVNPGQALAYKLGQLKFLELRKRAQDELGPKYDIRAFHDEMLNGGALPLDVLGARTNAWIETVKAGGKSSAQ